MATIGQKKEHEKLKCMGCTAELDDDHLGIKCTQGHSICMTNGCAKRFCGIVLNEPDERIPLKCDICKANIILSSFERQLNTKEYQLYLLYVMKKDGSFIDKNTEEIVSCPYCNYWEINEINDGRMMIHCKNKKCKTVSCYHCKKQIESVNNNDNSDSNDSDTDSHSNDNKDDTGDETKAEYDIKVDSFEEHYICAKLALAKAIWDKALEDGVKRRCPQCGLGGIKNNACMFKR